MAIDIMPAHAMTMPTGIALINFLLAAIAFNAAWTINLDVLAGKQVIKETARLSGTMNKDIKSF